MPAGSKDPSGLLEGLATLEFAVLPPLAAQQPAAQHAGTSRRSSAASIAGAPATQHQQAAASAAAAAPWSSSGAPGGGNFPPALSPTLAFFLHCGPPAPHHVVASVLPSPAYLGAHQPVYPASQPPTCSPVATYSGGATDRSVLRLPAEASDAAAAGLTASSLRRCLLLLTFNSPGATLSALQRLQAAAAASEGRSLLAALQPVAVVSRLLADEAQSVECRQRAAELLLELLERVGLALPDDSASAAAVEGAVRLLAGGAPAAADSSAHAVAAAATSAAFASGTLSSNLQLHMQAAGVVFGAGAAHSPRTLDPRQHSSSVHPRIPVACRLAAARLLLHLATSPPAAGAALRPGALVDRLVGGGALEACAAALAVAGPGGGGGGSSPCSEAALQLEALRLLAALTADAAGAPWEWPVVRAAAIEGCAAAAVGCVLLHEEGDAAHAAAWAVVAHLARGPLVVREALVRAGGLVPLVEALAGWAPGLPGPPSRAHYAACLGAALHLSSLPGVRAALAAPQLAPLLRRLLELFEAGPGAEGWDGSAAGEGGVGSGIGSGAASLCGEALVELLMNLALDPACHAGLAAADALPLLLRCVAPQAEGPPRAPSATAAAAAALRCREAAALRLVAALAGGTRCAAPRPAMQAALLAGGALERLAASLQAAAAALPEPGAWGVLGAGLGALCGLLADNPPAQRRVAGAAGLLPSLADAVAHPAVSRSDERAAAVLAAWRLITAPLAAPGADADPATAAAFLAAMAQGGGGGEGGSVAGAPRSPVAQAALAAGLRAPSPLPGPDPRLSFLGNAVAAAVASEAATLAASGRGGLEGCSGDGGGLGGGGAGSRPGAPHPAAPPASAPPHKPAAPAPAPVSAAGDAAAVPDPQAAGTSGEEQGAQAAKGVGSCDGAPHAGSRRASTSGSSPDSSGPPGGRSSRPSPMPPHVAVFSDDDHHRAASHGGAAVGARPGSASVRLRASSPRSLSATPLSDGELAASEGDACLPPPLPGELPVEGEKALEGSSSSGRSTARASRDAAAAYAAARPSSATEGDGGTPVPASSVATPPVPAPAPAPAPQPRQALSSPQPHPPPSPTPTPAGGGLRLPPALAGLVSSLQALLPRPALRAGATLVLVQLSRLEGVRRSEALRAGWADLMAAASSSLVAAAAGREQAAAAAGLGRRLRGRGAGAGARPGDGAGEGGSGGRMEARDTLALLAAVEVAAGTGPDSRRALADGALVEALAELAAGGGRLTDGLPRAPRGAPWSSGGGGGGVSALVVARACAMSVLACLAELAEVAATLQSCSAGRSLTDVALAALEEGTALAPPSGAGAGLASALLAGDERLRSAACRLLARLAAAVPPAYARLALPRSVVALVDGLADLWDTHSPALAALAPPASATSAPRLLLPAASTARRPTLGLGLSPAPLLGSEAAAGAAGSRRPLYYPHLAVSRGAGAGGGGPALGSSPSSAFHRSFTGPQASLSRPSGAGGGMLRTTAHGLVPAPGATGADAPHGVATRMSMLHAAGPAEAAAQGGAGAPGGGPGVDGLTAVMRALEQSALVDAHSALDGPLLPLAPSLPSRPRPHHAHTDTEALPPGRPPRGPRASFDSDATAPAPSREASAAGLPPPPPRTRPASAAPGGAGGPVEPVSEAGEAGSAGPPSAPPGSRRGGDGRSVQLASGAGDSDSDGGGGGVRRRSELGSIASEEGEEGARRSKRRPVARRATRVLAPPPRVPTESGAAPGPLDARTAAGAGALLALVELLGALAGDTDAARAMTTLPAFELFVDMLAARAAAPPPAAPLALQQGAADLLCRLAARSWTHESLWDCGGVAELVAHVAAHLAAPASPGPGAAGGGGGEGSGGELLALRCAQALERLASDPDLHARLAATELPGALMALVRRAAGAGADVGPAQPAQAGHPGAPPPLAPLAPSLVVCALSALHSLLESPDVRRQALDRRLPQQLAQLAAGARAVPPLPLVDPLVADMAAQCGERLRAETGLFGAGARNKSFKSPQPGSSALTFD